MLPHQKRSFNNSEKLIFTAVAAFFLFCCNSLQGQIVVGGDLSEQYNGIDDPWELGSTLLIVGQNAEGRLFIFGNSVVNDGQATMGQNSGVVSEAIVSGPGAQWNHAGGTFTIGAFGIATLDIDNGGVVTGFRSVVGSNNQGTVTVSNGSQWINSNNIEMANSGGTGTINIESGSLVSSRNGEISNSSSGMATVTVTGSSTWNNSANLSVGNGGTGTLLVEDGSVANAADGFIGFTFNGIGDATITGTGSQWNNTGEMIVGRAGQGTLLVADGGLVTSLRSIISNQATGTGTATVTGAGSQWNNTSDFFVGGNSIQAGGTGTLNIADGGSVTVETTMKVWDSGTVNLDGNLEIFRLDLTESAAPENFNMMSSGMLTIQNEVLGTLKQDDGTFAVDSFTPVDITGNYEMNAGAAIFDIGGTIRGFQYDALDVGGTATLNGTMDINLVSSFQPIEGSTFQLFDVTGGIAGNPMFDFSDAALGSELSWDTSSFLSSGSISVISSVPEPGSATLLALVALSFISRRRR
jgi:T5SS/PEP-CTERM-associated repeat protein